MAALRGARDVESLLWIDKYCTNGVCVTDDGVFKTNMIKIYVVEEGDMSMQIVRGFKHVLMMCGLAYAGFPVLAIGNTMVKGFNKEDVTTSVHRLLKPQEANPTPLPNLHECLWNMCKQYKHFMVANVIKMVQNQSTPKDLVFEDVSDNNAMLMRFLKTSVMVCKLEQRSKDCEHGHVVTFMSVAELLNKIAVDKWCFFGSNHVDFTHWNLHLNLCYAFNSHEVVELMDQAYSIVYNTKSVEQEESMEEEKQRYTVFSNKVVELCEFKHGDNSVDELLNFYLLNHVKKCRSSFYKSKYEERIRLIYCMVWHIIKSGEEQSSMMERSVSHLFDKLFREDRKWQLPFATMYNRYCALVGTEFTEVKRRKVRPWKRAPEDDINKKPKTEEQTVFSGIPQDEDTSNNDEMTYGHNGWKNEVMHQTNLSEELGGSYWQSEK